MKNYLVPIKVTEAKTKEGRAFTSFRTYGGGELIYVSFVKECACPTCDCAINVTNGNVVETDTHKKLYVEEYLVWGDLTDEQNTEFNRLTRKKDTLEGLFNPIDDYEE